MAVTLPLFSKTYTVESSRMGRLAAELWFTSELDSQGFVAADDYIMDVQPYLFDPLNDAVTLTTRVRYR